MDIAQTLGWRFIERRDVFAQQNADGSYHPVREPIKKSTLLAHLSGERTIGHYLVSPEGKCRLFAYDIDLVGTRRNPDTGNKEPAGTWNDEPLDARAAWLDAAHPAREDLTIQMRCLAEGLAERIRRTLELPVAIAYTGCKGLHVYAFTGSEDAAIVRSAALNLLDTWCFEPSRGSNFYRHKHGQYTNFDIEVFPKQATVGEGGFGNLMRAPLGVNRKTGQEGFFVDTETPYNVLRPMDAMAALGE